MSLFEAGRRTRYDWTQLGSPAYTLLCLQYATVKTYCDALNASRPDVHTQQP